MQSVTIKPVGVCTCLSLPNISQYYFHINAGSSAKAINPNKELITFKNYLIDEFDPLKSYFFL